MPRGHAKLAGICGWALLVFTSQALEAQSTYQADPEYGSEYESEYGVEGTPTGMDQMRLYPHPGPEWAATHGYPNYDYPDRSYDIWFRSQAWGVTKRERCALPEPWRPRGLGNLFARPNTSHRMDYNRPYVIHPYSEYGPSYYLREPDPRCCARDCDGHIYKHQSRARERALERALNDAYPVPNGSPYQE